jgi:hypothetical protein
LGTTTFVALILDTGPLYATLDRDDAAYRSCRKLVEDATEPLVIPALVLVEVDYRIHQRLHPGILVALLDDTTRVRIEWRICGRRTIGVHASCATSMPTPTLVSSTR